MVYAWWQIATIYPPQMRMAENLRTTNAMADRILSAAAIETRERGVGAAYPTALRAGRTDLGLKSQIRHSGSKGTD